MVKYKNFVLLAFLITLQSVLGLPIVYHPSSQVTNGTFGIGDFVFQDNITVQESIFGKYNWTIFPDASIRYFVFDGGRLQYNESYLNSTILKTAATEFLNASGGIVTNMTLRIDNLIGTNCPGGFKMVGVNSTGGVECLVDLDTSKFSSTYSIANITTGITSANYNFTGSNYNFTRRVDINVTYHGSWCTYQNSTGALITENPCSI